MSDPTKSDFANTPLQERTKYGIHEMPKVKNNPEETCIGCGDIFVLEEHNNKLCFTCASEWRSEMEAKYKYD
jgi:hypothetical protein